MGFIERNKAALNDVVSASVVGKYFHLDGSGHVRIFRHRLSLYIINLSQPNEIKNARFTTELRAGLTTFFTMAYIIAVNVRTPNSSYRKQYSGGVYMDLCFKNSSPKQSSTSTNTTRHPSSQTQAQHAYAMTLSTPPAPITPNTTSAS
jgi:hypothetical protein